jgi:HK97 family phage prohead protease
MERAFSVLDVRGIDQDSRILRGVATTPTTDRLGDIIEPLGITFKNPMAFLWQHKHDQPIGTVEFETPTADGINFKAQIAKSDEPGTLKNRLDEAWQSIRMGLVRAVSIGFMPLEYAFMDGGGMRFTKSEVYELSAVTIPANADAVISVIRSIDDEFRTIKNRPEIPIVAPGGRGVVRLGSPARVGVGEFHIRRD